MKLLRTVFIALAMVVAVGAARASAQDLTGVWAADDGGNYFIRQIGSEVWWFGDGGTRFANVAHGHLEGDRIRLQWADVPRANTSGAGELVLEIEGHHRLVARRGTGGFGGRVWRRQ